MQCIQLWTPNYWNHSVSLANLHKDSKHENGKLRAIWHHSSGVFLYSHGMKVLRMCLVVIILPFPENIPMENPSHENRNFETVKSRFSWRMLGESQKSRLSEPLPCATSKPNILSLYCLHPKSATSLSYMPSSPLSYTSLCRN